MSEAIVARIDEMGERIDLEDRLVDFAVRVINVVEALPTTKAGTTLLNNWSALEHRLHRIRRSTER